MAVADPSADSELEYLCLAHLNICGLRNKHPDVEKILTDSNIHVLALTETHLDNSVKNSELHIEKFRFYRKDRNSNGGGVCFYIHDHMTVIQRYDLDHKDLEMIWVEIYLPDTRPVLVGCCYRPSGSKIDYLIKICRKIEMVSNEDKDIFLLGDFNFDWSKESTKKTRIDFVSSVCGLTQIVKKPARAHVTNSRSTSKYIDHIYTNIPALCSEPDGHQVKSISNHKLITATVRRRVPRSRNSETDPLSEPLKSPPVLSEVSPSEFLIKKKIMENKHCSLEFRKVEDKEVERLMSDVDAYVLQAAAPSISAPICHILNSCIHRGKFPSENLESCVFRPDPILEKVLLQQMQGYFYNNELFTHHQTLGDITDHWLTELKKKRKVGVVFIDFSSSSDVISPNLLLPKLKSYHFSDSAISIMRSFLSDGNSCSCRWTDTHCEMPRGSCMTHFLFSVYTNDLKVALKSAHVVVSNSKLMMYHSEKKHQDLQELLRDESEIVRGWLRENSMVLKTFTSTVIRTTTQVKKIQTLLRATLSVNVQEFNWIGILGVLLHDAPHLVWTS